MTVAAPRIRMLIDGQFVESATSHWQDVINPATQDVLAQVPFATTGEVDAAVAAAKEAFKTWRKTPIGTRARIFLKYQQLIRENMSELAHILTAEQGKTLPDAEGDVFRGLELVEHAAAIGNLQLGELANNVANGVDTYSIMQPLGVCAGITPFNFPAMIPLWMFPMAIATGNTFILKPSEQDPMVTMRLVELALEAGIPKGVLNVVHGGEEVVNAICDHPDIKAVSFVGSTRVGTHVYNRASLAGKRVQCMMGAKNHAVVLPDANKEQTLNAMVGAAFGAAGQRCMAASTLVLVGEARGWVQDLVEKAKTLKVSGGTVAGTDVGPVISCSARDRVEGLIASGVEQGAKLVLDGRKPQVDGFEKGNFVGPTILPVSPPTCASTRKKSSGRCWSSSKRKRWMRPSPWSTATRTATAPRCSPSPAPQHAGSRKTSTSARSASTCRSRCRCRCSRSPVRALPSWAIWVRTASRWCCSTRRPRPSPRAGSTTRR